MNIFEKITREVLFSNPGTIKMNEKILLTQVIEPEIGKTYIYTTEKDKYILVKVLSGTLFAGGRLSNFWTYLNLETGEEFSTYGGSIFEAKKVDEQGNYSKRVDAEKVNLHVKEE